MIWVRTLKKNFYSDDTIIYALAPSITQVVNELQVAFQSLKDAQVSLKLVLNSQKIKFMFFLKAQVQVSSTLS